MDPIRRRRLKIAVILVSFLALLVADLLRAPEGQLTGRFLVGSIHLYQKMLSPRMRDIGVRCRFRPTCSHYAEGAIRKYGAWTGSWKALGRILRCGPWTPAGTVDPP
jgi:putative membrane protein insertion efficiency factor